MQLCLCRCLACYTAYYCRLARHMYFYFVLAPPLLSRLSHSLPPRPLQVKGGGSIPTKGTVYTLEAVSKDDFKRDVLKSDTAVLELPQLELVMEMGTLGSMYTTVEGLLNKVTPLVKSSRNPDLRGPLPRRRLRNIWFLLPTSPPPVPPGHVEDVGRTTICWWGRILEHEHFRPCWKAQIRVQAEHGGSGGGGMAWVVGRGVLADVSQRQQSARPDVTFYSLLATSGTSCSLCFAPSRTYVFLRRALLSHAQSFGGTSPSIAGAWGTGPPQRAYAARLLFDVLPWLAEYPNRCTSRNAKLLAPVAV